MQVVELLTAQGPMDFPKMTAELGIPKSSLYGLLLTMTAGGFLDLDENTRNYRLGIRIWEAGQAYDRHRDLVRSARPILRDIRDELNETAQLAVLDGIENVYVAKVDANQALVLVSHVGSRLPAYTTGLGKALLSGLTDQEVSERYEGVVLTSFTTETITDLPALLDNLSVARRRGYATDSGEYTPGVFCVASPVRDATGEVVAALSVSVPSVRVDATMRARMIKAVRAGAQTLSARLGGAPLPTETL